MTTSTQSSFESVKTPNTRTKIIANLYNSLNLCPQKQLFPAKKLYSNLACMLGAILLHKKGKQIQDKASIWEKRRKSNKTAQVLDVNVYKTKNYTTKIETITDAIF